MRWKKKLPSPLLPHPLGLYGAYRIVVLRRTKKSPPSIYAILIFDVHGLCLPKRSSVLYSKKQGKPPPWLPHAPDLWVSPKCGSPENIGRASHASTPSLCVHGVCRKTVFGARRDRNSLPRVSALSPKCLELAPNLYPTEKGEPPPRLLHTIRVWNSLKCSRIR